MEEKTLRGLVVETGHALLEKKLVARTWGNISCRLDEKSFLITPSGLDYLQTQEEDISIYRSDTETWEGRRKPSSEKRIHAAVYAIFPEVGFVIHTHQTYATALGLAGWESMEMTEKEREELGKITRAEYGLPGQKSLSQNVEKALKTGAKIILMVHHGALICGKDAADAMKKAELLETVCERNCKGVENTRTLPEAEDLTGELRRALPFVRLCRTPELDEAARQGKAIPAQLDDMAQMIGNQIPVSAASAKEAAVKLKKYGAVLVRNTGCYVCGKDRDDTEALAILAGKAAVSAIHTAALGVRAKLPAMDILIMNLYYRLKYSKQKGEKVNE